MFGKRGLVIGVFLILVVLLGVGVYGRGIQGAISLYISYPKNGSIITDSISSINLTNVSSSFPVDRCWYILNGGPNTYIDCSSNPVLLGITLSDGFYNLVVRMNNTNEEIAKDQSSFFIDTLYPGINFVPDTADGGANLSQNYVVANVSVVEVNTKNISYNLYNISRDIINKSVFSMANQNSNTTLVWNLPDGIYYYDVFVVDVLNQRNSTERRKITLDTIVPAITIDEPKDANYTTSALELNFSVGDINLRSCWFTNDNGINNYSLPGCANINYVAPQGTTRLSVYADDFAGNENSDDVIFYVDSIAPSIVYENETTADETNTTNDEIMVNVTATDSGIGVESITINLYDSSGGLVSPSGKSIVSNNYTLFSTLADGVYHFNATAVDYLGNSNSTATRTVRIDNLPPILSLDDSSTENTITINIYADDVSGLNGTCISDRDSAIINGTVVTENGLTCGTAYIYNISCWDNTGHLGSAMKTISTSGCPSGGSGGGGSHGGGIVLWGTPASLGTGGTKIEEETPAPEVSGERAGITGGAIGGLGAGSYMAILGFLLAVVGAYLAITIIRSKKSLQERVKIMPDKLDMGKHPDIKRFHG